MSLRLGHFRPLPLSTTYANTILPSPPRFFDRLKIKSSYTPVVVEPPSPYERYAAQAENQKHVGHIILGVTGVCSMCLAGYISDVGAQELKPMFIAMSAVTVVTFDLGILAERWLRHRGRLTENTSWIQKGLSILGFIAAVVGGAGLVLLAIFDTLRYTRLHRKFLAMFIIGYIISAIFITAEYWRLSRHFKHHTILRASFWVKIAFIIVEVALSIAFGVIGIRDGGNKNIGAILEWVIALIFTGYIFSYFMDLAPAVRTKHHQSKETEVEMAMAETNGRNAVQPAYMVDSRYGLTEAANNRNMYSQNSQPIAYVSDYGQGHVGARTQPAGTHDGTYYPDRQPPSSRPVAASRNF